MTTYEIPHTVEQPQPPSRLQRRRVADLIRDEQPLYRLLTQGKEALSTTELLALILGTDDALALAEELLTSFGSLHRLAFTNKARLMQVYGMEEKQIGRVLAVLELSLRLVSPEEARPTAMNPSAVADIMSPRLRYLQQEELHLVLLDTCNKITDTVMIYRGTLNSINIRVADVFRPAVEANAASIILVHNHPSGDCSPSLEDIRVTEEIAEAGELFGITLLDHIVVGGDTFASLKARGEM